MVRLCVDCISWDWQFVRAEADHSPGAGQAQERKQVRNLLER